jgi:hypothetical protein
MTYCIAKNPTALEVESLRIGFFKWKTPRYVLGQLASSFTFHVFDQKLSVVEEKTHATTPFHVYSTPRIDRPASS